MKETDDGKTIDGQDAGAVPAASTNSRVMYQGIFDFARVLNAYYYTPDEWSRQGMWGPLPDERNTELTGVNQDRRDDETSEENIKNYKSQR